MTLKHINRKTHAIELSLTNLAGQQSLDLLANDDGQQMRLTVQNVSGSVVDIDPAASGPQLEVRFRKGVVTDVAAITLQDETNWSLSSDKTDKTNPDTDSITLQAKTGAPPAPLQPGESWTIILF